MGSGFRTFASGEVLTASNVQNYLMDQAVMVFAGTAARASALPSPEVGMTAYSTATGLQVYNGTAWVDVSTGYGSGTGGSGTAVGTAIGGVNYNVHTFTTDANFVVTKAGLFDVLMFGGGGAGGAGFTGDTRFSGGGGGAGGKFEETIYLAAGTVAVDIGAGGAGSSNTYSGAAGDTEIGGFVVAVAGGRGAYYDDASRQFSARSEKGGSGGGGTGGSGTATNGSGLKVLTQGNDGGTGVSTSSTNSGAGGGGGAGAVGGNGSASVGGDGGAGVQVNTFIGGSSLFKAGGGGGARPAGSGGAGGSSIGGAGASSGDGNGGNAAANTASGGGGANGSGTSGNGGSGIAYIRYRV